MWIVLALGSAFFAGLTAILAKCGIRQTSSTVATALRTLVILLFSWGMVFLVGSQHQLSSLDSTALLYLLLSGMATGLSWLCYFRALQLGNVNHVAPIDKSSLVLTVLFAFLFLNEPVSWGKGLGMILITVGTFLMIKKKKETTAAPPDLRWLPYALGSALFASLTAILAKVGLAHVESNLGTALRTVVVLVFAWLMVFVSGDGKAPKKIPSKEMRFILLSGLTTGASWLCYYRALQEGPASVVVPLDKTSLLITVILARVFLKEKLTRKSFSGLVCILLGTFLMLF